MKTSSLVVVAIVLSVIAGVLLKISEVGQRHFAKIDSYEECVAAGNPIMESYPSKCMTPDGRTFVNPNEHVDMPLAMPNPVQTQPQQYVQNGCAVGGCSGEICAEATDEGNLVSNCMYRAEFACYKTARCERQVSGKCGWSVTSELTACLQAAPHDQSEPMVY